MCIVDTSFTQVKDYFCILEDRSKEKIISMINGIVRPGCVICTDEFINYNSLRNDANYVHNTVCYKYHFVEQITGVHTQNFENFNDKLKVFIKGKRDILKNNRS